ncbi:amidohydrolase family protein [Actinocrispum sp. NPDC049592]|uniref:amidohydrolase family protein n=1 Tax=Actinocrispum sp. NPDC049592 TaxID=3154835 RepID=UPI003433A2C3
MRIDVHHHALPKDYVSVLRGKGIEAAGGRDLPAWDVAGTIAMMDAHRIDKAIVSVSAPGANFGDPAEAGRIAREVNEFLAELVKDRPDRFGFFATLTLPDVDTSLAEIAHAFDELSPHGVILLANSLGTYLGDPAFDPVMAELDYREAVVFVHPNELPGPEVPGIPPFAADFLLDTTRAAANLVMHDVPARYPAVRYILSHAGGFLPYASHRIGFIVAAMTGRDPAKVLDTMAGFYYDTALSASPAALPSLLAFAKPGRVLFGSDWPFAPEPFIGYFTSTLDAYPDVDDDTREAINHGNARVLFGTDA